MESKPEPPTRSEILKKKLNISQQLQDKYKKVFTSAIGREVLGDLMERFRFMGGEVTQDAFHTQKYAAQREVVAWIILMSDMNYIQLLERMDKQLNP